MCHPPTNTDVDACPPPPVQLKIEIKRDVELGNPNKPSGDKGRMLSGMV